MAIRSVRITLSNATDSELRERRSHWPYDPCHGSWSSDELKPPGLIWPKTKVTWQSESSDFSIATGTEGWVKFEIFNRAFRNRTGTECALQVVYIHWNNPFIWGPNTKPLDVEVANLSRFGSM